MFVVTITSNCSGFFTSWCAVLSTIRCQDSRSGYSGAISSNVRFSIPSVSFMMLAFVAHVTVRRPSARASSNAKRTIFSQPLREISFSVCATPGDCMCSMPAYRSSTFSRTMTMSIPRPLYGVVTPGLSRRTDVRVGLEELPQRDVRALLAEPDRRLERALEDDPRLADRLDRLGRHARGRACLKISAPASRSSSTFAPDASTTRWALRTTSGPIPSPGMTVTRAFLPVWCGVPSFAPRSSRDAPHPPTRPGGPHPRSR